jgi:hypothetical protein
MNSRTCKNTQTIAQSPATGQAMATRSTNQMMAKRGLEAMVDVYYYDTLLKMFSLLL